MKIFIKENIKYLRTHVRLTQAEFGNLFGLSRSNIDSYERGNARPHTEKLNEIAKHFGLTTEIVYFKDLKLNPGLLHFGAPVENNIESSHLFLLKEKDERITELQKRIQFLEKQVETLIKIVENKN